MMFCVEPPLWALGGTLKYDVLCWYVFVLSVYQLQSREEKKVEIS